METMETKTIEKHLPGWRVTKSEDGFSAEQKDVTFDAASGDELVQKVREFEGEMTVLFDGDEERERKAG